MYRLILFCVVISFGSNAQTGDNSSEPKRSFSDRLYVGGDLGLYATSYFTFLNISPIVGYNITDNYSAGIGAKYQLLRDRFYDETNHYYGGSIFNRYLLGDFALLHAEYEMLSVPNFSIYKPGSRTLASMFFVGGGLRQEIGRMSYFQILLLYDLIDDSNSPYQYQYFLPGIPLIFRGGIVIGL